MSLALFVALALRSLSEVPLSLFGYGPELLTHVLLLITLAACARQARPLPAPTAQQAAAAVPMPASSPPFSAGFNA
jgi:hypothetical protein